MNGIMEDYLSIIRKYDDWISSGIFRKCEKDFISSCNSRFDDTIWIAFIFEVISIKNWSFLENFVISSYFINSLFSHWNINYDINYDIPNLVDIWIS